MIIFATARVIGLVLVLYARYLCSHAHWAKRATIGYVVYKFYLCLHSIWFSLGIASLSALCIIGIDVASVTGLQLRVIGLTVLHTSFCLSGGITRPAVTGLSIALAGLDVARDSPGRRRAHHTVSCWTAACVLQRDTQS